MNQNRTSFLTANPSFLPAFVFLWIGFVVGATAAVSLDEFMVKRGYAVVPLKNGYNNRFFAQAKLNGKPVNCLLDTGAGRLFIDRRKAAGLGPTTTLKEPIYALFGKVADEFAVVNISRLELSAGLFTNYPAVVEDLHRDREVRTGSYIPTSRRQDQYDLVLGMSFLVQAHGAVSCERPALYLRQEALNPAQADNFEASLQASGYSSVSFVSNGVPILEALVNGKPALLVLDTGATFTTFDLNQVSKFELSDQRTSAQLADAAERKQALRYAHVNSIKLADFDSGGMPVGVADLERFRELSRKLEEHHLPPLLGYVGPEVLYRAKALIDCSAGRVYVRPAAKSAK